MLPRIVQRLGKHKDSYMGLHSAYMIYDSIWDGWIVQWAGQASIRIPTKGLPPPTFPCGCPALTPLWRTPHQRIFIITSFTKWQQVRFSCTSVDGAFFLPNLPLTKKLKVDWAARIQRDPQDIRMNMWPKAEEGFTFERFPSNDGLDGWEWDV